MLLIPNLASALPTSESVIENAEVNETERKAITILENNFNSLFLLSGQCVYANLGVESKIYRH